MNEARRVLVIDDEEAICSAFRTFFERRDWQVHACASGGRGLELARKERPDIVFLDVRLPDGSGLDVLDTMRREGINSAVIVITAFGSLDVVTRALQGGAADYLVKPIDLDHALELARRAVRRPAGGTVSATDPKSRDASAMIGASRAIQEVYKQIALVAQSDANVLILGETGTGKELVARAVHRHSDRRERTFCAVNCGAIPEGLVERELFGHVRGAFTGANCDRPGRFEDADGGTLLLDEVGELSPAAQVKLLRVLDTGVVERLGSTRARRVDVRVLAATNRPLHDDVRQGRFRADLFYRLAVVRIQLPPLRERREDVVPLARHFLQTAGETGALSEEALAALTHYDWPGNVRELQSAVVHAALVACGGPIFAEHLPDYVRRDVLAEPESTGIDEAARRYVELLPDDAGLHRRAIEPVERAVILRALARCGGNQSEAAALLGMHRNTLHAKLRSLGESPGHA